jgi:hypothetical protein
MNAVKIFLLAAAAMFLFSACGPSLKPFTQELYQQNQWTERELKGIQFYLSDDIVLTRALSGGTSEIISGKVKVVDGRRVEEVVIPRNTPGVLMFIPKEDRLAISFEEGGRERFLIFGPNPKVGSRYVLMGSEWSRQGGTVTYEGKKWDVNSSSAYASLLINLKKVNRVMTESRRATGRRIG